MHSSLHFLFFPLAENAVFCHPPSQIRSFGRKIVGDSEIVFTSRQ
ncbi:hypothetical protein ALO_10189 [Acetonema longum DSM 6540]|uniref:Uncharacterized protein n=1 Tax=Acetonema longum DSM 6540 TaxID=1009370 RepID=F7NIY5_9FIRM|nr:hypothetical protein ALO_10189 [Acetonema longum DSM 6540]